MIRIIAAAMLLGLASLPAQSVELKDYVGDWRGKGTYTRTGANARSGALTCRLQIAAPSDKTILIDGRCAAPEGTRGFKTEVSAGNGSVISGVEISGLSKRPSSGTLTGAGLSLNGSDSKGSYSFKLSNPLSGAMQMNSMSSDEDKGEGADVSLQKRQ